MRHTARWRDPESRHHLVELERLAGVHGPVKVGLSAGELTVGNQWRE